MKLKKLILTNFRAFKDKTVIEFNNLTVFVGQNDVGKSTILEALDIFFNEKDAIVTFDSNDYNVYNQDKKIIISAVFTDLPDEVTVDATAKTSLVDEHLLNKDRLIEIKKIFTSAKLKETQLIALYPSNPDLKDLLNLKIDELRERAQNLGINNELYKGNTSSSIRKAIIENYSGDVIYKEQPIVVFKEKNLEKNAAKEIWGQLQNYLPTYALFQSDRKNEEKDKEIQNPINYAIKSILKKEDLRRKLNDVKEEVENASKILSQMTISKLKEMNPELAKELKPNFQDPKWENVFKFSLTDDNDIALDKRGSGVRRLILINFFRAEAERKRQEREVPNIIYALEEPETSQHPYNQQKLINAFMELADTNNTQIILTTHSPGIAKLIPEENLILVSKSNNSIIIKRNDENIVKEIAETLGVLPNIDIGNPSKVKLVVCLEGKNDIEFLLNINRSIPEFRDIIDLNNEDKVIMVPMGGSALQFWVNKDYIGKLNLNQVHIFDSDIGSKSPNKYKKYVDEINNKGEKNFAFETKKRELENYIHPDIIKSAYDFEVTINESWDTTDISELISINNLNKSESSETWDKLEPEDQKERKRKIKNKLNSYCSNSLTKQHLEELNAYDEISSWFEKMSEFIQ
jgi:predicted ATP-dependent endonuclease of OLD family